MTVVRMPRLADTLVEGTVATDRETAPAPAPAANDRENAAAAPEPKPEPELDRTTVTRTVTAVTQTVTPVTRKATPVAARLLAEHGLSGGELGSTRRITKA